MFTGFPPEQNNSIYIFISVFSQIQTRTLNHTTQKPSVLYEAMQKISQRKQYPINLPRGQYMKLVPQKSMLTHHMVFCLPEN